MPSTNRFGQASASVRAPFIIAVASRTQMLAMPLATVTWLVDERIRADAANGSRLGTAKAKAHREDGIDPAAGGRVQVGDARRHVGGNPIGRRLANVGHEVEIRRPLTDPRRAPEVVDGDGVD